MPLPGAIVALPFKKLGQYDKAVSDLKKAIEIDPGYIDSYLNLGFVYFQQKNNNDAVEITSQGLKIDPKNASLYDNLGYIYIEKGDNRNAISTFRKCLDIDNKNLNATLGLSIAYFYNSDLNNARQWLDQAKKLEPRLNKGMDGIAELEKAGYSFTDKKKITLKKLFTELK